MIYFLRLKGKNRDGNLFVKDAFKRGASLAVVSRFKNAPKQIKVKNTLEFLTKTSLKIRENTSRQNYSYNWKLWEDFLKRVVEKNS